MHRMPIYHTSFHHQTMNSSPIVCISFNAIYTECGAAQWGSAWIGSSRLGLGRLGSAWVGLAPLSSAGVGSAWLCLAQLSVASLRQARLGPAWLGFAWLGSAGLDSAQLAWPRLGPPLNFYHLRAAWPSQYGLSSKYKKSAVGTFWPALISQKKVYIYLRGLRPSV